MDLDATFQWCLSHILYTDYFTYMLFIFCWSLFFFSMYFFLAFEYVYLFFLGTFALLHVPGEWRPISIKTVLLYDIILFTFPKYTLLMFDLQLCKFCNELLVAWTNKIIMYFYFIKIISTYQKLNNILYKSRWKNEKGEICVV